jgi:Molybdate transporter of MFS superfamily
MWIAGNRYDLRELNGAFGVLMVAVGLWFRTPMPVQPMKAIAAVAVSQPGLVTPGAIWASGLFTGALWLVLGLGGICRAQGLRGDGR